MTDKERFEDIKKWYQRGLIDDEDIEWLINRVEELEKVTRRYKKALKSIKNNYPVPNEEFIPVEMIYEINLIVREALEGKQ